MWRRFNGLINISKFINLYAVNGCSLFYTNSTLIIWLRICQSSCFRKAWCLQPWVLWRWRSYLLFFSTLPSLLLWTNTAHLHQCLARPSSSLQSVSSTPNSGSPDSFSLLSNVLSFPRSSQNFPLKTVATPFLHVAPCLPVSSPAFFSHR